MSILLNIADRVLNRPLLITPAKAAVILSVLADRMGVEAAPLAPDASRFVGSDESGELDARGRQKVLPYRLTEDGTGVITVIGSLVNRGAWIGANSGLTSYEGVKHQIAAAVADPKVKSIVLDLHTPGGEAIGAFETAAAVRAAAKIKPVIAVVNGMAASAGYAIASGATEIVTTETGISGSIGVVLLHADYSRKLDREGVTPTLIFAGAHKVDGNPFEVLPDSVRADLQAEVDGFYQAFLGAVAAGRGKRLTQAAARKTDARTFPGQAAVEVGLADRVGSFEGVLAELGRAHGSSRAGGRAQARGKTMTDIPQAEHDAAVAAAREAGRADGLTAGRTEGEAAAAARLATIVGAEGVKDQPARLAAAINLATKQPSMAATDVIAFVTETIPVASGEASFQQRMAQQGNPALGTGATTTAQGAAVESAVVKAGYAKAVAAANKRFGA